jgi:hypothetical protein
MAYIYEVNGQRVEFEKEPTDADIDEAAKSLGSAVNKTEASVSVAPQVIAGAKGAIEPIGQVAKTAYNLGKGSVQDLYRLGDIALNKVTPAGAGNLLAEFASSPVQTSRALASAYLEGHPWAGKAANTTVGQALKQGAGFAGRAGSAVAQGVMAPESLMALPYQAAAYEQEKIRANPAAPEYANNPYAMSYRSQGTANPITQGQAGAMNQRNVVANMPYGNVNPQERAMLDQDRANKERVQAQAKSVLQQPPTAQNFIERMKALSTLYTPAQ